MEVLTPTMMAEAARMQLRRLHQRYYLILMQQDVQKFLESARNAVRGCFPDGETPVDDTHLIEKAVAAVAMLEFLVVETADEWDRMGKRESLVLSQPLTRTDKLFKARKRRELRVTAAITGRLVIYHEMGMDSGIWAVEEAGSENDYPHLISGGDRLVIYDEHVSVIFDEVLIEDYLNGWMPEDDTYPYGMGSPWCIQKVQWLPKGQSSLQWAKLYTRSQNGCVQLYKQPRL